MLLEGLFFLTELLDGLKSEISQLYLPAYCSLLVRTKQTLTQGAPWHLPPSMFLQSDKFFRDSESEK